MEKIRQKIMNTNFAKKLKQLVILALCVAVLGGGLSAVMLKTQISEAVTYTQEWHEDARQDLQDWSAGLDRNDSFNRAEQDAYRYGLNGWFERAGSVANMEITEPTTAAKVTVTVTGVLLGLVALAFWMLIAAWLYQAAVLAGMNGLLWLVLGLAGNVFAAVAFLIVRNFTRKKCSACGGYQSNKTQYCAHCGAAFDNKCSACGESCSNSEKFCHACGKELSAAKA